MKRLLFFIQLLLVSLSVLGQTRIDTLNLKKSAMNSLDIAEPVSLVRLITYPEKYDGKRIMVIGYLHLEFESDAVYLHKQDNDNDLSKNGFWVNFSETLTKVINPSHYNDKYVLLIGTFDFNHKGHMDMYGGTLRNITWIYEWGLWKKAN